MNARSPVTRAVLYDPPVTGPMAALTECRAFGMLPFANRPLLHHLISQLAESGIREIDVFTASHFEQVADYLGAGERWGVRVRCHRQETAAEEGLPREVVERLPRRALVMRLDCWPGKLAMLAFLEGSGTRNRQLLGERGPLACFLGDAASITDGNREWPMVFCYTAFRLDSPSQYLRANLDCLVQLGSRNSHEQPYDNQFYLGAGCRMSESARFEGPGLLGAGSRVAKRVNFGPDVVAGEHVFLDAGCDVRKSVILDGTYVGAGLSLRGKIVDGSRIIDCKSGEVTDVKSSSILAKPIRRTAGRKLARGVFRWLTARPVMAA